MFVADNLLRRTLGANSTTAFILFLCSVIFSCSKKEEKIPADILPKEKMVELMVDVHLAEAQSQAKIGFDNSKTIKQAYYKFIFNKYQISYSQFAKSFDYYSAHPEVFSEIYDNVITELSKKQAESSKK